MLQVAFTTFNIERCATISALLLIVVITMRLWPYADERTLFWQAAAAVK